MALSCDLERVLTTAFGVSVANELLAWCKQLEAAIKSLNAKLAALSADVDEIKKNGKPSK